MRFMRVLSGVLFGLLWIGASHMPCMAEAKVAVPSISAIETVIGDNMVRYPQLTGMTDEQTQERINNAIVELGSVAQRMITLATLQPGGTGLMVDYDAFLKGNVLSGVIDAVGVMENGRSGQAYAPFAFDLNTGMPLTLDALFSDVPSAVSWMEDRLSATYLDELGSYVVNAELSPLPATHFSFDQTGITFYYPQNQFSLVSGYGGAAHFTFGELHKLLRTEPDAIPAALGLRPEALSNAQIKAAITHLASQGMLPGIPVKLSDPMSDVIAQYRLLREPDQYHGGRYCQMEAPMFRQTLILTDALTAGYDHAVVNGILSYRANLFGIQVGVTTQTRWREILGTPENTVEFDESLASSYALPMGTADYYQLDGAQLLLYADTDGVLYAVRLTLS